jgi:hypothetical protein
MCTLTFIAGDTSHHIAMNRDERVTRGAGKPPEIHQVGGTKVIYPSDGEDGTWIGLNDYGIVLALVNWNDVVSPGERDGKARSRGQIIPALIGSRSLAELSMAFKASNVRGMLPFRLVGIFPFEKQIWEWRWDCTQLDSQIHKWRSQHWFSSSLSDKKAEGLRGAACRDAHSEPDAGSVAWLRRLHASHAGGAGAFSVCVHREDVRTLSYTEVVLTPATVVVEHFTGSPCSMGSGHLTESQLTAVSR